MTLPTHIAIIMDGNGRWAKQRNLPRTAGHKKGAETLKKALNYLRQKGIRVVTLFAFSSENWNRPQEEVQTLMNLFRSYLKNDVQELIQENVRLSFIGNRARFDSDIQERMNDLEAKTATAQGFHIVLALSYGARDDIICATKAIAQKVQQGTLSVADITPALFAQNLSTRHLPDPDFVIRTSGEERISNFLLWELAYAELYFTPVFWPDFDEAEIDKALDSFARRQRRFGGLSA